MIKIYKYGEVSRDEIFARDNIASNVAPIVSEIIANVIKNGDAALYEYCEKFDKALLSSLEVSEKEIDEAFASVEPEFIEIIKEAAENIKEF
ncbi:MAG: histidinol dehydrogenase, partial [Clostridia bacterium]|nr:histidinol dehydrogenase [Clostridia bacterium]